MTSATNKDNYDLVYNTYEIFLPDRYHYFSDNDLLNWQRIQHPWYMGMTLRACEAARCWNQFVERVTGHDMQRTHVPYLKETETRHISTKDDFYTFIGHERGRPRLYNYVFTRDGRLRIMETSLKFISRDMASKHIMLAEGDSSVFVAGDLFIDYHRNALVISNNSGTFRPTVEHARKLARLLEHTFPGLSVVVVDALSDEQQRNLNRFK